MILTPEGKRSLYAKNVYLKLLHTTAHNMSKLPELESYLSPSALFILRVLIGVVLGLLTVYRRDLSSNREYHTDGDALDTRCEETISRSQSTTADKWGECSPGESKGNLRRRASSSSLPSLCNTPPRAPKHIRRSDPTEELLESAGFVFSGGPFLAVMLAVVDHLMLTVFLTSVASVSTLMWRRKDAPGQTDDSSRESEQEVDKISPQMNQSVHQVALNAATEYFNDISSKLEKENSTELSTQVLFNKPKRSRSVNNISQISEEECLDLITLARGHLDISLLPSETQISIFSFLHPKDLLQYTCTNKKGMRMLTDAVDSILTGEEENNIIHNRHHAVSERNTAMLIWKELFQRDYAWILREWKIGQEALQRSLDVLTWDGFDSTDTPATLNYHTPTVLQHILSTTGIENNLNEEIIMRHPLTSMKEFYFTFAETWLNYTIAGCNSTEKCLIGLHGHVFDISNFVEQHPGSTETLLLQAGRDATGMSLIL